MGITGISYYPFFTIEIIATGLMHQCLPLLTTPIRLIRVPLTNLSRVVIEVSESDRLALDAHVMLPL